MALMLYVNAMKCYRTQNVLVGKNIGRLKKQMVNFVINSFLLNAHIQLMRNFSIANILQLIVHTNLHVILVCTNVHYIIL